ncbi:MAG: MEKHLA domain-containing protein [Actinomycetota bacterium]
MTDRPVFPWQQEAVIRHTQRLLNSFSHWTGKRLLEVEGEPKAIAQALFEAPFVIISHGMEADPIFNYANCRALELWELDWQEFTRMPSRYTAEPMLQEERNRLLAETIAKGFSHFRGVRISSTGKRFLIENGLLWNVLDEQHQRCGQAAVCSQCTFLS